MDPQQRLMLETTWEALERAASTRPRCAARRPGCSPASTASTTAHGRAAARPARWRASSSPATTSAWPRAGWRTCWVCTARRCRPTPRARRRSSPSTRPCGPCGPGSARWRWPAEWRRCPPGHAGGAVTAAGPVGRRPVQGVRGRGRRHRLLRGRGRAGPGAALRRAPQRPPDLGGDPRLGDQPGRGVQRTQRAQPAGTAGSHPGGPGRRRSRGRRRGCRGGARHRHPARRPHGGGGAAGHLRAGPGPGPPAVAGLAEVEHRPYAGRGRGRRHHQDDHGDASRSTAEDAARRPSLDPCGLVGRRGGTADRGPGVDHGGGPAPPRRACPPSASAAPTPT